MLQTPPPARILPSEWFPSGFERVPSGFRVVSERFPSGSGVFQTCPKTRVLEPSKLSGSLSPAFRPSKLFGGLSGGVCPGSCPADFVPSKLSGGLSGVVWGFKPVWTQNVKTSVYAEPPLSRYMHIYRERLCMYA